MYELHRLGWNSFQQLCQTICREVLGQTVESFLDSNDAGKDGAFAGTWTGAPGENYAGRFVIQCKFTASADRNLKHAQNQKEYETAMRETDALQKQIAAFETQVVEAVEAAEEVEKELAERAEEIDSLDAKRNEALAAFDAQLANDKAEFESETQHRQQAFSTLPARLASVYDRLAQRSRDGIAVAEVVNGSCSACFMSLRPQMQVNVKKGDEIITCESCTRILYVSLPNQSEASAS